MRKVIVAILLLTYTFAVSGASVELHYCMGKLIGADFSSAAGNRCNNCGMVLKHKKGCCDERQVQVKINQDQQPSTSISSPVLFASPAANPIPYTNPTVQATVIILPFINAPPPKLASIFILQHNFRI